MKQRIKALLPNTILDKFRGFRDRKRKSKNEKLYFGNAVHCPICTSSYRLFGPTGLITRENARCHNCGALERHRLLYLYLKEELKFFDATNKPLRLLHFAPEKMFYELFSNHDAIQYTPCDLFPEKYPFQGKTKISKVDITKIPFEDDSFDFILCNHVLEHIPDDQLAMQELYRVMAKNGQGVFQVPLDESRTKTYEDWSITTPKAREKAFGQHDHVRWYGQDYKKRLKTAGFEVNEIDYPSTFSSKELFKFGLMASEKIYHVKKTA